MQLTIKAIRYKGQPLEPPLSAIFDEKGGSLGRSSDNHLVLADAEKIVSGKHAIIEHADGHYYYVDTSLNGTQFSSRNQMIHNRKIMVNDQDELKVGDYDLVMQIEGASPVELPSQDPSGREDSIFAFLEPSDQPPRPPDEENIGNDLASIMPANNEMAAFSKAEPGIGNDRGGGLDDSFTPPEALDHSARVEDLPDDLSLDDFFGESEKADPYTDDFGFKDTPAPEADKIHGGSENNAGAPAVTAKNESPPGIAKQSERIKPAVDRSDAQPADESESDDTGSTRAKEDLCALFLEAAGIEDPNFVQKEQVPVLMQTVGVVFRELIEGLMTILRGRTELKSQFRVAMTLLKPAENNPLKFSPTVDEALKLMLTGAHPGFLDGVDAVRSGYEDVKNHQLAITAGVQASLMSILKRFDPQRFAKKYDEGFVFQKKARCWDEYSQLYPEMAAKALEDFFGSEFVRAYEQQMDKLRRPTKNN